MMDTRHNSWSFMYGNAMFYEASGIGKHNGFGGDLDELKATGFWETFEALELVSSQYS